MSFRELKDEKGRVDSPANLFNQLYQIKSTKPNLQNQIYLAKCLKFREPNLPTQIFFNQTYKTKSTQPILPNQNQAHQTKTESTRQNFRNVKDQI